MNRTQPSALVSVSDKRDVERIATALREVGFRILSTGGTARHLREHGVEVVDVSAHTGFPEILDGRVKTLHPRIHGGILARREPKHAAVLKEHDIDFIDVVIVNLYPFGEVSRRAGASEEEIVENIDIGGPCMVRAAAKNFSAVTVVTDPDDYDRVIETLPTGGPDVSLRRELAQKAFAHTARYDDAIADYLFGTQSDLPTPITVHLDPIEQLRYGENPHQSATLYTDHDRPSLGGFVQLHGKHLSYNNIVDVDGAVGLIEEFDEPAAAVIKHTNPAGCATADDISTAFDRALACDPVSAFGGIVALNRPVGPELAHKLVETFFEVIVAPRFDSEAVAVLTAKKNLRLLVGSPIAMERNFRPTLLGWLVQQSDPPIQWDRQDLTVPTKRQPTDDEWRDLAFACRTCKHVKSNAIVLARDGATIGVGAGQMSRVDAVELAVKKSRVDTAGAVMGSDAFFPFRDGPDAAAAAGVTAIVQPGGSRRDDEVIAACDEHGIAMVFTGHRHFRH